EVVRAAARAQFPEATAEQIEAEAGEILRLTHGPTGVTTPGGITIQDPETGEAIEGDVLIQLLAGRARPGTLSHEQLHSLGILAGLRREGGMLVDPDTGQAYNEEQLANALEAGV
ncbi:MAG: hypothetical protein GWN71_02945, partial [Gammaproteobacteria bacterium]|nr:hypothetical protein [Gammaproteobacteria bacterium]